MPPPLPPLQPLTLACRFKTRLKKQFHKESHKSLFDKKISLLKPNITRSAGSHPKHSEKIQIFFLPEYRKAQEKQPPGVEEEHILGKKTEMICKRKKRGYRKSCDTLPFTGHKGKSENFAKNQF
jgi:hypothetical protein